MGISSRPHPHDESHRLESLRHYELLDTPPEQAFDEIAALAALVCDTPLAAISLIDENREWFKSTVGLGALAETARDSSFGGRTILQADVFVVSDAAQDPRFTGNPLLTGELRVRFYAGAPLVTAGGDAVGALFVMDRVPRQLTPPQESALRTLSRQVMAQMELRRPTPRPAATDPDLVQRLAAIVESSDDAIIGKDLDGIVTTWNRGAEQIFGYTADEIVGTPIVRLIPSDRHDEERQILDRIRRGEGVRHFETVRQTKSGQRLHVSITASPIRDASGRIVGASKVARDITDQKRADANLARERSRAQRYLDTADVIMLALDLNGRITLINRKGCDLLGQSEHELLGASWVDVCVPERLRPALSHKLVELMHGDLSVIENPILTRSGEERMIEWHNNLVRDDAGLVVGTFSSGSDVTEKHRAVEALRAAEERIRFILDNAEVGIWDLDYPTGRLQWSKTVEAHYGLDPGTFGGTFEAFMDRVHPDDRAALLATVERATQTGADFSTQHRTIWPDGSVRWLSGFGRVLVDGGRATRAVGITLDVTERHSLEAQYHQAQKMEAVGRLAGGIAHDFNNLLSGILGYCELILDDLNPQDPMRADLTEIQKAGTTAASLTRQLLAFSRKQIIEPALLDLNVVVSDMRGMLGRLIGEDVAVDVVLSKTPARVVADRGQLEQILMNLAVNARDAMPGGGRLTIETAPVELDEYYADSHFAVKPGPYIVLTVTDTGTGIPPEIQARLFEPFFTTKEQGKGTGLGLATVHGIVSRSGGNVGVYSEIGKGTSFKVYLPRADDAEAIAVAMPELTAAGARTQTILVVEDSPGLRELTRRLLDKQGYTVLVAGNAAEALDVFERHPSIDVLLTDVVMPGASGPELTAQLVARRPGLKVIYMSGYTEDAIVHHGVLRPGIAFLHKPFTSQVLVRKIQEVLSR